MDQNSSTPGATIRIARTGTFTSNEGVSVSFAAADLARIAATYDPASDPAPLVVGHPQLDDPAYGWVEGLKVEDGVLVASAGQVEPSFAEMVNAGRFKKVSARFYPPEHPSNPSPGAWYLKHIGFLGAAAPGIKGLGTVQFADGADDGALTLDFNEPQTTEKPMPKEQQEQLASFAEREAELKAREDAIAAREESAAKAAAEARHKDHVSFAEGLVDASKLAPAGKALVVGLLDHFDATAVVSFGEGQGDMAPAAALRKLLETGKPLIDLSECGNKPEGEASYTSFAAPDGYEVDPAQADLYARAKAIQDKEPTRAWMDCVRQAQGG